jgi:hypothetical protein
MPCLIEKAETVLIPTIYIYNRISTVVVGTSIVYTVKQGTWNLVRVSLVNSYLINLRSEAGSCDELFLLRQPSDGCAEKKYAWMITHCSMTSFAGMFRLIGTVG